MKMFQSTIPCECGSKEQVKYKRPSWGPENITKVCDGCESKIHYLIKKGPNKDDVIVKQRVLVPSDDLLLLRLEEHQSMLSKDSEQ